MSDDVGEWFEILNATDRDIDLSGLEVYDLGSELFTVDLSVILPAGGRAALGTESDPLLNGGVTVDYAFGSAMDLGNGDDELYLAYDGLVIDGLAWDGGSDWPDPSGASLTLDPALEDAASNDDGDHWCEATSPFGSGDLGTPGAPNDPC